MSGTFLLPHRSCAILLILFYICLAKKNPYEDSHKSLPALMNLLALQTYNKFFSVQAFFFRKFHLHDEIRSKDSIYFLYGTIYFIFLYQKNRLPVIFRLFAAGISFTYTFLKFLKNLHNCIVYFNEGFIIHRIYLFLLVQNEWRNICGRYLVLLFCYKYTT